MFDKLTLNERNPDVRFKTVTTGNITGVAGTSGAARLEVVDYNTNTKLTTTFGTPLTKVIFILRRVCGAFSGTVLYVKVITTIATSFISGLFFKRSAIFDCSSIAVPLH